MQWICLGHILAVALKRPRLNKQTVPAPQTRADSPLMLVSMVKWFTCRVQEVGARAVWSWCFCPVLSDSSSSWWSLWDVYWKTPERQKNECVTGCQKRKGKGGDRINISEQFDKNGSGGKQDVSLEGKKKENEEKEADSEEEELSAFKPVRPSFSMKLNTEEEEEEEVTAAQRPLTDIHWDSSVCSLRRFTVLIKHREVNRQLLVTEDAKNNENSNVKGTRSFIDRWKTAQISLKWASARFTHLPKDVWGFLKDRYDEDVQLWTRRW